MQKSDNESEKDRLKDLIAQARKRRERAEELQTQAESLRKKIEKRQPTATQDKIADKS